MRISLSLFASLREGRFDSRELELAEGPSVGELADLAGVPRREIAIIFVDGRHAEPETVLHDGARVAFFPPVGGG